MILPEFLEVQFGWGRRTSRRAGLAHSQEEQLTGSGGSRIIFIVSGHLELDVGEEHVSLYASDIAFIPPPTAPRRLYWDWREASDVITVGFRLLLFGNINLNWLLRRVVVWHPDRGRHQLLFPLMEALSSIPYPPSMAETLVRDGAIRAVLGLCWDALEGERIMTGMHAQMPRWLNLVMQEIRHYPNITVAELERLTGFRHSHFNRLFKKYVGYSPQAFLQQYRGETAKRLLATTNMSITAIAEHLGFATVSDFTRFFRRVCAATPTEYRLAVTYTSDVPFPSDPRA